ncbi:hypothetical protein [Brucella thiophenivorans]|uniref:hypothetical protein n=1 Tax=Brucella thiophenivorans TaxID=571255 RepID=UPI00117F6C20|nr:hypothetical protein [Brucella thiophenivorans]
MTKENSAFRSKDYSTSLERALQNKTKKLEIINATTLKVAEMIMSGSHYDPGNLFKTIYSKLAIEEGVKKERPAVRRRKVNYDEVISLHKSGLLPLEISELLCVNRVTVYRIIRLNREKKNF